MLLFTGNPSQGQRQTLPLSKRLENKFPSKWSDEKSWSTHSNIEENRLPKQTNQKGHVGALHTNQR